MAIYKVFRKVEFRHGQKPLVCYQTEKAENHESGWAREMDAWFCYLDYDDRQIKLPFFMGIGRNGEPPDLFDVLDCCFRDGDALEHSFGAWCREWGYDDCHERHRETYESCVEIGKQLQYLFGSDFEVIRQEIQNYYY